MKGMVWIGSRGVIALGRSRILALTRASPALDSQDSFAMMVNTSEESLPLLFFSRVFLCAEMPSLRGKISVSA